MLLDGSFIGSEEPVTLGHEGVGTIEEMGDKVKGFNLGDRVGFLPNKACCFTCRGCQIHNLNCENLPQIASPRLHIAFNSLTHPNYLSDLKSATGGLGASAAAVFAASNVAYASAPKALRAGGVLMVVGLPPKPIEISAVDMMLGLYRIKSETTGPPWKLPRAIEFTARHGIKANVDFFELGDINEMIDQMGKGETVRRMVVVF
jgi:D-arabinose 1-dehydrogenase-like Zn-dependent alcohol dehydrogenase